MSGVKDLNAPAFDKARDAWKAKGWQVISPVDLDRTLDKLKPEGLTQSPEHFSHYLRRDFDFIIGYCTAIAFLPGWHKSRGALHEAVIGQGLDLEFYDAETFEEVMKPIVEIKVLSKRQEEL